MSRTDLSLISQPASTDSRLFAAAKDAKGESDVEQNESEDSDAFVANPPRDVRISHPIAGRVPASNGAFGLVQGVDGNLGAGMRVALFRGLKEVGLGFVETIYENTGGDFHGPLGSAIALKYKEKTYEPGSHYLKEDEVRKACDERFRKDGRDIIWVESEGISEVGGGAGGTLPIGVFADANASLKLKGIVRYRRLEPFESASGKLLKGQAFVNAAGVPITATLARRMPPGGEFEITGVGSVSFVPELEKPAQKVGELGKVGVSAKVGAKIELKGETTISVQRLPFGEEVLVKIAYAKSSNRDAGAELEAGLKIKKKKYEKLPELGRGVLKYLLDRMGLPDAPAFAKQYLRSQIQLKSRYEKRSTDIARFVFDLSKPNARKAYEEIFTRLSLGKTKALVSANDSAIRAQKAGENVSIKESGLAATLGQSKLLLRSALELAREGKVSIDGRASVVYRDCKYEKNYINWFLGEKKIKWEVVTVDKEGEASKQSYFHLAYSNSDRITQESEIEGFLRLARALGIQTKCGDGDAGISPAKVVKVLADRDDTQTRLDLYFTSNGIKRIASATKDQRVEAYLEAEAKLSDTQILKQHPLLKRFQEIANMWFFVRVFYWGEMSRLKKAYAKEMPERRLKSDAKLMQEAGRFAENVARMAQEDEKSTHRFFIELGKASGFEYMRKIAALSTLASMDESILHELSIAGGGLTLGAVDEGEMLHPEKAMNRMLTRIA